MKDSNRLSTHGINAEYLITKTITDQDVNRFYVRRSFYLQTSYGIRNVLKAMERDTQFRPRDLNGKKGDRIKTSLLIWHRRGRPATLQVGLPTNREAYGVPIDDGMRLRKLMSLSMKLTLTKP